MSSYIRNLLWNNYKYKIGAEVLNGFAKVYTSYCFYTLAGKVLELVVGCACKGGKLIYHIATGSETPIEVNEDDIPDRFK